MEKFRVSSFELRETRSGVGPIRVRRLSLATRDSQLATSPAFTLIELLVVIGIIGIVIALGVPLFGVLTGSRSQEAGQNLVAAAIGQARTIAVNEGKYAGILFYVDPATERTAMSLVVVADPQSGLEDPDPYDKYKTFVSGQEYRSPYITPSNRVVAGDRVIDIASDASATFRSSSTSTANNNVYDSTTPSPAYSRLSLYVSNYKPTVRVYRGRMAPSNAATGQGPTLSSTNAAQRPVRNGPYYQSAVVGTGTNTVSPQYRRIQPIGTSPTPSYPTVDATDAPFSNDNWGPENAQRIATYSTGGEQQLLPIGVGVQLIIQPTLRSDDATTATPERYVRTGVIMFDPQGRLTLDSRALDKNSTIGKYLSLNGDINTLSAGVGIVLYDRVAFKADPTRTDADWISQNVAGAGAMQINAANTNPLLNDNASTTRANEVTEESWLDANTTPLLINRFSGALSEGQ